MRSKAAGSLPRFRWQWAAASGFAILVVLCAIWGIWLGHAQPGPVDFLSFWAAGRLALHGKAAMAYSLVWHKLMEQTAAPIKGLLPFPYPPPFLLFVTPFAVFPYWTGFTLWLAVTGTLYVVTVRKFAPLPYPLAHPAVTVNSWIGQNGFLTCGIFAAGLTVLGASPFAGGAIFGLLIIKPQLAVLVPIAFVASRQWWAIVGSALSAVLLLAIAYALFGLQSYQAFFSLLPQQATAISNGLVPWNELASVFSLCRFLGIPKQYSFALQALAALGAAAATWRAWALRLEGRGPTLAAATLLVPPYLLTYDSLLLVIPMGWLIRNQRHPAAVVLVWILCLLPIVSYSGAYKGPNTIPVAAIICVWLLQRRGSAEIAAATPIGSQCGSTPLAR
jgi:hypothetical protein